MRFGKILLIRFALKVIIFGVVLFLLALKLSDFVNAGCTGSVTCYVSLWGGGCSSTIEGQGGCSTVASNLSSAACYARETDLMGDCDGDCVSGACNWTPNPTPCVPLAPWCGNCSVSCGGGTKTCYNGCTSWTEACNTQSCCTWGSWTNAGCGASPCGSTQMKQTRTTNPYGCVDTYQCLNDSGTWVNDVCGGGGCPADQMHQTRTSTYGCLSTSQCVPNSTCSQPKGYHDGDGVTSGTATVSPTCRVNGWTCDPSSYSTALGVHVYENAGFTTFRFSTTANIPAEPGVGAECGGFTNHRFLYDIPTSSAWAWDGFPHTLYTYAIGINSAGAGDDQNPLLVASPRTMICNQPPTCSVSIDSGGGTNSVCVGDTTPLRGSCVNPAGSSLSSIGLYTSPTLTQSWTPLANCSVSGNSASCPYSNTWGTVGTYYAVVNGTEASAAAPNYYPSAACTGNPWCTWHGGTTNCSSTSPSYSDCDPTASRTDEMIFTVEDVAQVTGLNSPSQCDEADVEIQLGWDAVSCGTDYQVWRCLGATCVNPLTDGQLLGQSIPPGSTSFIDYTGINTTTYTYRVRALKMVSGAPRYGAFSAPITVTPDCIADPWWQVEDADVLVNSSLMGVAIPSTCTLSNNCTPYFDVLGSGGYPGIPVYTNNNPFFGTGDVSEEGWMVNTLYASDRIYSYDYFNSLIPSDLTVTEISDWTISQADITNCVESEGYCWLRSIGDTAFTDASGLIDVSSKRVVLLVGDNSGDGGDVTISSRINLLDGSGFLMVIADGNITVDPSVGAGTGDPDLEGIYFSDGTFYSGNSGFQSDVQLRIRGSVVAWEGVNLQRDLSGSNNNTNPAEFVEFAPDQLYLFPPALGDRRVRYIEVAP